MGDLVGKQVKVTSGACAGETGVISEIKTVAPRTGAPVVEYRISFDQPVHFASIGWLAAVWRKAGEFEGVAP
jgi:hypothetical protein